MNSSNPMMNDPLDEVLDTDGMSGEDLDGGGGICDKEGWYHVTVLNIDKNEDEGKLPHYFFGLQILAGDHEDQAGKMIYHRIFNKSWIDSSDHDKGMKEPSEGSKKMKLRFAAGLGLISKEDIGKPNLRIPWSEADGVQAVCKVVKESRGDDPNKFDFRIPYSEIYQVNDPKVENVPKDQEALDRIGLHSSTGTDVPF